MSDDVHVVYDIPPRYARLIHLSLGLAGSAVAGLVTVAIHCFGG